ncbi:hypothetical protein [Demequina rhizosphaerae]|uniref:hypothetical protein n=1 Tax=Demequina rhizosphaerae TaxID=1638985 RepID=UPI000AA0EC33|nr:hypothetical protein [Demequina rhizosphaerae]
MTENVDLAFEDFPLLREALDPDLRDMASEDVVSLFAGAGLSADEMEWSLGKALSSFGRTAARLAPSILPVAGTVLGTAVGGPLGGALGGSLGSLAGKAVGSATARSRQAQPRVSSRRAPRRVQGPPAGAAPAAAQLVQVLNRPEILRALQSMAVGRAGTPNVNVGSSSVPVGAIANLIGTLAGRAAAEHHVVVAGADEAIPEYLLGADGEAVVDVADESARAGRLLELLDDAVVSEAVGLARGAADVADDWFEDEEDIDDEDADLDEEDLWDLLDALEDDDVDEALEDDDEDFEDEDEDWVMAGGPNSEEAWND